MIVVTIPDLRLTNPLNNSQGTTRGAAMAAARKRKAVRTAAAIRTRDALRLAASRRVLHPLEDANTPFVVSGMRIVRIAPRPLDTDNLAAAAKSVRDGVADALGIGDAQQGDFWRYGAESQGKGVYAVRIELLGVGE